MSPENNTNKPISAVEFTPIAAPEINRSVSVSRGFLALLAFVCVAAVIMVLLYLSKPVIFKVDPADADIKVSGLSFNIGENYLFLKGNYQLEATKPGYSPLIQEFSVGDADNQEIPLKLLPLPGNIEITSSLSDIRVSIDGQPEILAPTLVIGVSQGVHQLTISKYRYFSLDQEFIVEGLGKTQQLDISLKPAWGEMRFTSTPTGADLYIGDNLRGQTPLTTEVLETGSKFKFKAPGYKTFSGSVSVKAGTVSEYKAVELIISDGTLTIVSTPSEANITLDGKFLGVTPMTADVSPFAEHTVELYREGYLKNTQKVSIEPEQTIEVRAQLRANIGSIEITVNPEDAALTVDNRSVSAGSQMLTLPAKPHLLKISKPGYQSQDIKITPRPDQEQSLNIELLTLQEAYWASRPNFIQSPVESALKLFRPNKATFSLGAPRRQPGRRANEVERQVTLQRPFYLATKEISNKQFKRWKNQHSSAAIKGVSLDMATQPAVKVSWDDAVLFCNWLSGKSGLSPFYQIENGYVTGIDWQSNGYRLPTEAEWAWAAKVDYQGLVAQFPWKNNLYPPLETIDNYADSSAKYLLPFTIAQYTDGHVVSAAVGSFAPNSKGLYNMGGNVSEWTNDYYDIQIHRGAPIVDPTGPQSGNRHVIRGASWALGSRSELRLSFRDAGYEGRLDVGFRIARYVDNPGAVP